MRFGLFGTGPWAHLAHAPALTAHPDVEFVGVWGRNPDKAAALAGEHNTRPYADQDELIADVDAIAVALPPDVQAPLALRAARAGRHLLLDKPIAFTTAEAGELVAAVAEHDVASVVFFTRRLMPQLAEFLADAAATGGWTETRVDHLGSIFTDDNPFGASPWRKESGGLWDVGPHALAMVLPVLGPVTEVTGMAGPRDMTHLLLRHTSGTISNLTLSVDAPPAAEREEALFAGEAGLRTPPDMPWSPVDALGRAIDQLIAAASGGPASELDVRFGAEITAVLVAAREAIASGRTVTVGTAR
ncbi:Gfo/Idh/MocA family oxidoreductase [Actinoplanes sp. LDG1-06]|uniref:Gfo/Idh/MocA family oxidoreductase n=1 Tax=Paractinoplanes ovalisporus TaxID=2810368 RepID=A0ABS2AMX9_9ACTN|nr:Gfo/Idh/MocA family oxidoreductase [Actinoplanes ovalisporus]MBM2621223.1 Gfo/Idh/MocA family oxidoreductase [Actinoplanes ovalisporus]